MFISRDEVAQVKAGLGPGLWSRKSGGSGQCKTGRRWAGMATCVRRIRMVRGSCAAVWPAGLSVASTGLASFEQESLLEACKL